MQRYLFLFDNRIIFLVFFVGGDSEDAPDKDRFFFFQPPQYALILQEYLPENLPI